MSDFNEMIESIAQTFYPGSQKQVVTSFYDNVSLQLLYFLKNCGLTDGEVMQAVRDYKAKGELA